MPADERQATSQRLVRLRDWLDKGEKMLFGETTKGGSLPDRAN